MGRGISASFPNCLFSCKALFNPSFPSTYIGCWKTGFVVLTFVDTFSGIITDFILIGSNTSYVFFISPVYLGCEYFIGLFNTFPSIFFRS